MRPAFAGHAYAWTWREKVLKLAQGGEARQNSVMQNGIKRVEVLGVGISEIPER